MAAMANSVSSTETSAPSETNTFSESGKSQLTGTRLFDFQSKLFLRLFSILD